MAQLPPLRTVRDTPAQIGPIGAPTPFPPTFGPPPLDLPGLPKPARDFLGQLVDADLLDRAVAEEFARGLGTTAAQITTRDRAADALVARGVLTRYQATRAINGHFHGLVLGPYRVLDRIGSGTVGVVFLAEHETLRRRVAVKVLSAEAETPTELVRRFAAEVRVMAALDHPNLVTVYDAAVVPGGDGAAVLHYLAMELVPGGDLENFVYVHGPQPAGLVCEWGRQAASALRAAHVAGLVHRDVKPSNMLLTETRRVKLIDFGLVREFGAARTRPDTLLGSVEFVAPEQVEDAPTAGPPSDVYSLGATLFWLLSGQLPYPKERNVAAALAAIRSTAPRKLKTFCPVAPPALDALLAKMLSRSPGDRPTAAEVVKALAGFAVPSSHPAVSAEPVGDESEPEPLRAAVRQLEDELVRTARSLDTARAALMTGLAAAAVVRPGESVGHQKRVADYCRVLATELAQSSEWPMFADPRAVEDLARAAAAHDLGLVGVPDQVLTSPHKLTSEEKTWFVNHPVVAAGIFDAVAAAHGATLPGLRVARAVVRHHHERWDGSGFPDKLAGKAIPPAARIVAVADAYDTQRSGYPGRPGVAHSDAVGSIIRQSGVAFDPAVVRAFGATAPAFEAIYAAYQPEVVEDLEPEPDEEEAE